MAGPTLSSGQQEVVRWTAILAMVIDHVGAVLVEPPDALPMRAVGRLAWPLFAFLLAYNVARRGVDPRRYLAPLLLWCGVSLLPHYLAFDRFVVNILGTLLLGTATLTLLTHRQRLLAKAPWGLALGIAAVWLTSTQVEYGPVGVALVVCFWWALTTRTPLAWLATLLLLAMQNFDWVVWPYAMLALPVPFIVSRLRVGLPRSGRLPWLFYPLHLGVLAAVDAVLARG